MSTIVPQSDVCLIPISWPRWHHGHVRPSKNHADRPVLITEAPVNADDEFDHRRKRYLLMMAVRALCIVGAASTFSLSGWLAAGFVAAAVVLPWSAVLIANDRPPKQELRFRRFVVSEQAQRQLTSGDQQPASTDPRQPGPTDPRQPGPTDSGRPVEPRIIDI